MKSLFIILLAGYAVRSDENNYYVIERQEIPPTPTTPQGLTKKPFNVYWNVPTMQCTSKKIEFEDLYENFGIIQNNQDRFKGEKVTILYDPGLFPALFKNESGGKIRFRNGGVPQEGNLSKHLDEFKKELDRSIPDNKFSGIGIIDFESWRPQFRQNFGVLQPYKDVSFEIERKLHWWWKEAWIKDEAKRRFEENARTFMESTIAVAKKLRPLARWGFYGFPYCFNMASNNLVESCANGVPKENNEISWLWSESTALYPSVYGSVHLTTSQLVSLVRGRVAEAARCGARGGARGRLQPAHILPYFWYRYRDAGFLTKTDLSEALSTLYKSAATGIIIWGSSNDVNTVEKCINLKHYVQNVLGPAIAKYTKPIMRDSEENENNNSLSTDTYAGSSTSNIVSNVDLVDPEFHWMPPENYSQDLKNDVEEQINKKFGQNVTNNDKSTVLQNNSVLIDLILNAVLNSEDNATITTDDPKTKYDKKTQIQIEFVGSTTESNVDTNTDTSQVTNSILTNNPFVYERYNTNTTAETIIERTTLTTSLFDNGITTETETEFETGTTDKIKINLQIKTETVNLGKETTTTKNTQRTTYNDYDLTIGDDDVYDSDVFYLFLNKESSTINDHNFYSDVTSTDFTKNEKKVQPGFTPGLLDNIVTSTDKLTDIITNDESDILEVSSTEFVETESSTAYNNNEATNENKYITDPSTVSLDTTTNSPVEKTSHSTVIISPIKTATTESVTYESSKNKNESNNTRESINYKSNSSILNITTNSPNDIRNVEFQTVLLETSKTTEETNTSIAPETSTIIESEDTTLSTPIEPSSEQVFY